MPFLNALVGGENSTRLYAILTFNPEFGFALDKFDVDDIITRPSEWAKVESRWRRMLRTYQSTHTRPRRRLGASTRM